MKKWKFRIALAANILAGLLPFFLWRMGIWLDLPMVLFGFAGMAVLNYFFSRSWWQTALLGLPLLLLYPAFCYNGGMMYYYRISDDSMTKILTELFTYLSAIEIAVTQLAAVIVKAVVEHRKRKKEAKMQGSDITAEAVNK